VRIRLDHRSTLAALFPFLGWRSRVNRKSLRSDAIAGLSGAILVLPQAIAYATIAGLPPQYGVYAAMVPPSSRAVRLVLAPRLGPYCHHVHRVFATLSPLAVPGTEEYVQLAFTFTFLAGVLMLVMGIARMGALVNFVSDTVVIGFTSGAAVLIATSQLKNYFGVHITAGAPFVDTIVEFYRQLPNANLYVALVATVTLVTGVLVRRFLPRVPYMITAMVVAGIFAAVLKWIVGDTDTGIATVGALPAGLPPLSKPNLSFDLVETLGASVVAIAVLGLTEALSIARAIALKSHQRIDGNQEFIGQGLSNIMGSSFRRTRQADRSRAAASTTTLARRLRWRRCSRRSFSG
jgi:SulP family sulfate permease